MDRLVLAGRSDLQLSPSGARGSRAHPYTVLVRMSDVGEKGFVMSLPGLAPDAAFVEMLDDAGTFELPVGARHMAMSTDRGPASVARALGVGGREVDGRLAAVASVSDLLAVGALPFAASLALSAPLDASVEEVSAAVTGFAEACREYDVAYIGGDTKRGEWNLVSTAVGPLFQAAQQRRRGEPGDLIVVAGEIGGFAGAILTLTRDAAESDREQAVKYLANPRTPFREGRLVSELLDVSSATDASDGLFEAFSNVIVPGAGAMLREGSMPYSPEGCEACASLRLPLEALLSTGGDWNLVYAIRKSSADQVSSLCSRDGLSLSVVGEVTDYPGLRYERASGAEVPLRGIISDHFKNRIEDPEEYGEALADIFRE